MRFVEAEPEVAATAEAGVQGLVGMVVVTRVFIDKTIPLLLRDRMGFRR